MSRSVKPRAQALVIESQKSLRNALVKTIESSGRIAVLAQVGTQKTALAAISDTTPDLIVSNTRLSDATVKSGGSPDGVDLASLLKKETGAEIIFVSDFPEDITSAKSCTPLAYLPKDDGKLDATTKSLLEITLERFSKHFEGNAVEKVRLAAMTKLGSGSLVIDGESRDLLYIDQPAASMFGIDRQADGEWPVLDFLNPTQAKHNAFAIAVKTGTRLALSPTAIATPAGKTIVVSGQIEPVDSLRNSQVLLQLRNLTSQQIFQLGEEVEPGDTVLVLGVDQLNIDQLWNADETCGFMMDIRSAVREIVRSQDLVSLPEGNCVAVILRDCDEAQSLNLTKALLSHLHSVPQYYGERAASARFCVGLAQSRDYSLAMEAIVAANDALLCSQRGGNPASQIKQASSNDKVRLSGYIFGGDGIFHECAYSQDYFHFLSKLTSLRLNPEKAGDYRDALIDLILKQPGMHVLAIFFRHKSGNYKFLGGGKKTKSGFNHLGESELPEASYPQRELFTHEGKTAFVYGENIVIQPLTYRQNSMGYLALVTDQPQQAAGGVFELEASALEYIAGKMPKLHPGPAESKPRGNAKTRTATPMDTGIEGYVVDNMEGAVDQATFLAKLDVPVAIIGPRGTGKMYIAKIVHQEWGGAPGMVVQIDCRSFRNREEAHKKLGRELEKSEGKTLVFKSPQLLAPEVQAKLAKQLSTRTLADASPARYLPRAKYVALFPSPIDTLVRNDGLTEKLASVFSGYPINVPPIKDRKQAVLRWAHKILAQESLDRDKPISGFTPDAEQAMLSHEWQGNISEMRQCIVGALARTANEWITPVDLGIFKGISPEGSAGTPEPKPFLVELESTDESEDEYVPSALEALDVALGEAVHTVVEAKGNTALGSWLMDEMVLSAIDRYQGDQRQAADFLHTKPRNISRWMPKIELRTAERTIADVWRDPGRLIREWVRESPYYSESPQIMLQDMLMQHIESQCETAGVGTGVRAQIMGVSVPTYNKRLQEARIR